MKETGSSQATIQTERLIAATPRQVFAAFEQPEQLARWWGPDGFTNTFAKFDFKPGGKWLFVMHGPDGRNYANECIFREIQPDCRIALEHVMEPWFRLIVTLEPVDGQTRLTWTQEFESPHTVNALRSICEPANEQNLNRLEQVLAELNRA